MAGEISLTLTIPLTAENVAVKSGPAKVGKTAAKPITGRTS